MSAIALQATRARSEQNLFGVDAMLLGVFISLLALGLVMVLSSSIAMGEQNLSLNTTHFWRQCLFVALGLILSLIVASLPTWLWQKSSGFILLGALLLLMLLIFFGVDVNGSRRWMTVAGFRMQPGEIAKLAMIIYAASYLTRKQAQLRQFTFGIVNIGVVLSVIGVLLLRQPDFGSFFVITIAVGLMMFLGGIRIIHTLFCLGMAMLVMVLLIIVSPYRMARVTGFLDPWADPFNSGFQLTQALIAIGRGEIFGVGLGASIQKLYYLPHAHNDFIFAIIGEELGLAGIVLVIFLFAVLLHRALVIARDAELIGRIFAARLAQGIGFLLVFQAVVNIGVNLGVLPTKGITLPFVSYGGSSLLVSCFAMGLLFAIDRQNCVRNGETSRTATRVRR